jgi:hypothetical protein
MYLVCKVHYAQKWNTVVFCIQFYKEWSLQDSFIYYSSNPSLFRNRKPELVIKRLAFYKAKNIFLRLTQVAFNENKNLTFTMFHYLPTN